MVYDVTELKEYFGQRFNELKNSSNVINNALENFKSEIKLDLRNLQDKIDKKKWKHWNQTRNSFSSK